MASLWGLELGFPVLAAPWAGQALAHPDAEKATALAARKTGAGLVLSSSSSIVVEEIAEVSGPYLQQLYLPQERELIRPFLQRVVDARATGIILTVDQSSLGAHMPFRAGVAGMDKSASRVFPAGVDPVRTLPTNDLRAEDIVWLREATQLPVIVKGVLRADDARAAVDAGAKGVIVSNQGGPPLGRLCIHRQVSERKFRTGPNTSPIERIISKLCCERP